MKTRITSKIIIASSNGKRVGKRCKTIINNMPAFVKLKPKLT